MEVLITRVNVRQDNLLLHWRYSYLEVVEKVDGAAFTDDAIPHMFDNVKLTVGNQLVENIIIYDVLYPRSKGKCDGLQFMWMPETADAVGANNKVFTIRRQYLINTSTTNGTSLVKKTSSAAASLRRRNANFARSTTYHALFL